MLNKLILRAFLSISLALTFTGAANAALITQDLLDGDGGNIGSISINTDSLDEYGDTFSWEEFNLLGIDMLAPEIADGSNFYASFDLENLAAGLWDLQFDLVDVLSAYQWQVASFYDVDGKVVAEFDYGLSIYKLGAEDPTFAGYISEIVYGEATVVPTPATFILFLTAVAGLAARRKNH